VNIETFKDMLKRYEDFKMKNKREPRYVTTKNGYKVMLPVFKDMLRRYEDFVRINGREPNYISIQPQPNGKIEIKKFRDMLRRYEDFVKKEGREPNIIYLEQGKSDHVSLGTFKDMLRRYEDFVRSNGREPNYISIQPQPSLKGPWTTKVIEKIGTFHDATSLYERVKKTCKYKYYYNDQVPNHVAVMRITTSGINCTDACQLFQRVMEEMGYNVRIEHVMVKCNDGEWYGHYLLNVKGFEFRDWVIWDYVSATKTGRPLGKPCCVNGFKHLGWGIVSPRYD